jgi:hypothetical protein
MESGALSLSSPINQHAGKVADQDDGTDLRGILAAAGYVHDRVNGDA